MPSISVGIARSSHPLMPLVVELSRVAGDPHGGWVHWGATTQNVTQTGDTLVIRSAHRVLVRLLGDVLAILGGLAERGAEMVIAGRTHGQHAVPTTFGFNFAEYVCALGMLAATCGKIAREVFILSKPEFGELAEPMPPGTVGSSTMPHKRNPQLCQDVITISAQVRSLVPLALEGMIHEHEVDGAATAMVDGAVAQACTLTGDALARLRLILGGLELDAPRMRANLDLTDGLIMSESVMLALGARIGRQHAHDVVYDAAAAAGTGGGTFAQALAADPRVTEHLDRADIDALLDPAGHLGLSAELARLAATRARALATEINASYQFADQHNPLVSNDQGELITTPRLPHPGH